MRVDFEEFTVQLNSFNAIVRERGKRQEAKYSPTAPARHMSIGKKTMP